jgi:hypothetical protein
VKLEYSYKKPFLNLIPLLSTALLLSLLSSTLPTFQPPDPLTTSQYVHPLIPTFRNTNNHLASHS